MEEITRINSAKFNIEYFMNTKFRFTNLDINLSP